MDWKTYKSALLETPEVRRLIDATELEAQIGRAIIAARLHKGLTQKELAQKLGTQQSAISRIESGDALPSLALLKRVAAALGLKLTVTFAEEQVCPAADEKTVIAEASTSILQEVP